MIKKIEYTLKHNRVIQAIYVFLFSLFFKFLGLFIRPKKNLILFQSLIGKNFGESPKVLYDYILNDPYFKDYICVWAFSNPNSFPECTAKKIKLNSFKYFIYALRAKIWISNAGIERGLRFKHCKTIHINTDHGIAYKIIGNAQKNRNDYNFKTVDLFCCVNELDKKYKTRDYKIKESAAVICGYPTNDELVWATFARKNELRKKYNIPEDKKVILYAPTWRDAPEKEKIAANTPPIDLEKWEKELGDKYVLFFRVHHLVCDHLDIAYNDFIREGANGIPVNDMLIIADILISDYSAIMFNYSVLERPIVAFVYDNEQYQEDRGTYMSPFDVFKGSCFLKEDEVIKHIKRMDYDKESSKTKNIRKEYMFSDGNATKYCISFLKWKLEKHGKTKRHSH